MIFLIGLVMTCLNGWLFLDFLAYSAPFLEKLGLSFILSLGLHTVIFFMIGLISYRPSAEIYWLSLVSIFLALLLLRRKRDSRVHHRIVITLQWHRPEIVVLLSWILIAILFLVSLGYTLVVPVHTTDALHLYDFRAKVIYFSASLQEIRQVVDSWFQYPMFTTLANLFVRYWGMSNPSLIYPLLYLSFSFIFFHQIRKHTSSRVASVVTLLMFSTPLIYWQSRLDGLTNLPFAIFFCSSIFYLVNSDYTRRIGPYIIATLLIALSTWTRVTEPFWMVPLVYMSILVIKNKNIYLLLLNLYLFRRIRNLWDIYADNRKHISLTRGLKTLIGQPGGEIQPGIASSAKTSLPANTIGLNFGRLLDSTERVLALFIAAGKFIFPIIISSLSPVIFLFSFTLALDLVFVRLSQIQLHLLIIIAAIFALLWAGAAYSSVAFDNWTELGNSLSRILGFFVPLMWFFVGISPTLNAWDAKSGLNHD